MTTKLTIDNFSDIETTGISWQSVKTSSFTAVAGEGYFCNTTSSAFTVTLPSSPSAGDSVAIKDYAGTFASNNLTIARNGENIQGAANDSLISTNRASVTLVYIDSTKGWLYTDEHNVGDLGLPPEYVTATGGTVTTSGDYKIHTFTGDGCFVVSNAGFITPAGGSTQVDYLVLAGGGSGGYNIGGGGGAGGYRESHSTCVSGPYTASPLATPTGITVSATTYPITVGGGAAGGAPDSPGNQGSNSVFSTITSAGGGGGGSRYVPGPGLPGGSGGGGGVSDGCAPSFPSLAPCGSNKGSGNTPPVSPPQGNDGGGAPGANPASGGGGAGTAGSTSGGSTSGPGGNGTTSSITGSPVTRAGGGGGGAHTGIGQTVGTGGSGGGTDGIGTGTSSSSPANSGGGSGGGGQLGGQSGNGGKGIVIIRYKFQ